MYFVFKQRNSGGFLGPPALYVAIRAKDSNEAFKRLYDIPDIETYTCECCGDRWFDYDEVPDDEIDKHLAGLHRPKYQDPKERELPTYLRLD